MLYFENNYRPSVQARNVENNESYNKSLPKQEKPSDFFKNPNNYPNRKFSISPENIYSKDFKEDKKTENYDKRKQDDYYPFGKPGAGAPVRDENGQIIAKRPGNQFTSNSEPIIKPVGSRPLVNWTYDQHNALRDQNQDE